MKPKEALRWDMGPAHRFLFRLLVVALPLLILCACSHAPTTAVLPPKPPEPPAFPPQKVMESCDFAGFFAENQKVLKDECGNESNNVDGRCDVALFNLGFAHAYSKSPYYNYSKALRYFEELIRKYPKSPWAFQARAWTDIMKKVAASKDKQRRLKGELKSKDAAINGLQEQIKRSRDIDMEMERKERDLLK